jgi:hypothetical protein
MGGVRIFGDVASHLGWVEQSGFEVSSGDEVHLEC